MEPLTFFDLDKLFQQFIYLDLKLILQISLPSIYISKKENT
jgi:hypothetical protein